jgi:hypothetical protein
MEKNETIQAIIDQYRDYFCQLPGWSAEELIYSDDTGVVLSLKTLFAVRAKAQLLTIAQLIQDGKLKLKLKH